LTMQSTHQSPRKTLWELRGQLLTYFHSVTHTASIRQAMARVESVEDIERALADWLVGAD
jgi:hypothetical protein